MIYPQLITPQQATNYGQARIVSQLLERSRVGVLKWQGWGATRGTKGLVTVPEGVGLKCGMRFVTAQQISRQFRMGLRYGVGGGNVELVFDASGDTSLWLPATGCSLDFWFESTPNDDIADDGTQVEIYGFLSRNPAGTPSRPRYTIPIEIAAAGTLLGSLPLGASAWELLLEPLPAASNDTTLIRFFNNSAVFGLGAVTGTNIASYGGPRAVPGSASEWQIENGSGGALNGALVFYL